MATEPFAENKRNQKPLKHVFTNWCRQACKHLHEMLQLCWSRSMVWCSTPQSELWALCIHPLLQWSWEPGKNHLSSHMTTEGRHRFIHDHICCQQSEYDTAARRENQVHRTVLPRFHDPYLTLLHHMTRESATTNSTSPGFLYSTLIDQNASIFKYFLPSLKRPSAKRRALSCEALTHFAPCKRGHQSAHQPSTSQIVTMPRLHPKVETHLSEQLRPAIQSPQSKHCWQ
eukprot:3949325-Amphidinium_carterae.1